MTHTVIISCVVAANLFSFSLNVWSYIYQQRRLRDVSVDRYWAMVARENLVSGGINARGNQVISLNAGDTLSLDVVSVDKAAITSSRSTTLSVEGN